MDTGYSWSAVSAVAETVSAFSQTLILIAIPITISYYRRNQKALEEAEDERWTKFYAYLDDFYFKILQMAIERPHLVIQDQNRSGNAAIEYHSYAFITWNFLETIYDYSVRDDKIMETWHPILLIEAKKHGPWFTDTRNRSGFKTEFCNYIDKNGYAIV